MLVAKYKFDKSIYENLMPVFNDGYTGYTYTDEIDENNSNHIIRTIECDTLPTKMRFGVSTSDVPTNRELSLLEILELDTAELTSCDRMFIACQNVKSINTEGWTLNNVTSMYTMFYGCYKLTSLDVSNFNTSKVTNMYGMFYHCKLLTSLDVSNFDTSNVTYMSHMFYDCSNLTSIDVSNFNTSNVTDMQYMFCYCNKLSSIDVSNFDTNKVTKMDNMFNGCTNLTSLDVSNFDTSKVTNMTYMFHKCNNLTTLDVSNFDTSKVTTMDYMFTNTSSLQYIRCNNISTINTLAPLLYDRTSSTQGKIITTSSTNVDTTTLSSLNWSVDTSSGTKIAEYKFDKSIWNYLVPEFNEGYSGYFCNDRIEDEVNNPNIVTRELVGYGGLPTLMRFGTTITDGNIYVAEADSLLEILNMNTSELETMQMMFYRCYNVSKIECDWNTSNVINMYDTFCYCNNLTSLDVNGFNTSNVTNMQNMFRNCSLLTSLDVSNWDTSKVNTMYAIFYNCTNLTSLDVSNFDTSNVIDMGYIFAYCNNLTSLDVSNFDTSKVTSMDRMFACCNKLTSLDVSNFDTSNVTKMSSMFYECNNLTQLDVSNFDTSEATNMYAMFNGCTNLTSLDVSNFDTSKVTNMTYMFHKCNNLTTLDVSNFDTSKVTDFTNTFSNTPLLTDIGMLYCSQDTINKLIPLITDGSKTIWVKDTKASDYTATDYVTIKDYKEDNRTLYLNSPLLEGDEIVNKEGKLYHYHKMGKVELDGSKVLFTVVSENYQPTNTNFINFHYLNNNIKKRGEVYSNNFKYVFFGVSSDADTNCIWTHGSNNSIRLCIEKSKLQTTDANGLTQWLSENPTTIVYELAEPYYELISDDPLIVQSYAEGKLDTSSIITPTSIQFVPYEEELTYLYTSTQYCIQFNSTANCTVDITLGGTKVENKSVSVGLNKIYITTPSELVDNKLIINAKGNATISKVVVVNSNAEFDYFDGLKSSFEDCLVTDMDNENYGKYEVGVKIVGKNKFDINKFVMSCGGSINGTEYNSEGSIKNNIYYIDIPKDSVISFTPTATGSYPGSSCMSILYKDNTIQYLYANVQHINLNFKVSIKKDAYGIRINNFCGTGWKYKDIQIEEGTTATSYEPYKETNATIYLNSPLLQGDRIEVVEGKLCHYHKMGKVVLDGSNDEGWVTSFSYDVCYCSTTQYNISQKATTASSISDNSEFAMCTPGGETRLGIKCSKLGIIDKSTLIEYLQTNPMTVVYELANPYYEDITPIQSSFVISTVSEGDMEILTDLPIKSNITYLTNITSAVLMEQQLDELDNGTESLTNIVEDEINE